MMLIFLFSNLCGDRSEAVSLKIFSEVATGGILSKKLHLDNSQNSHENVSACK